MVTNTDGNGFLAIGGRLEETMFLDSILEMKCQDHGACDEWTTTTLFPSFFDTERAYHVAMWVPSTYAKCMANPRNF